MSKGSSFERKVCKQLSLWWTNGKRKDVFWRTSGSGATATSRKKRDQEMFGQHGDVQATDPIGQLLIDLFAIEIKKGYTRKTIFDLVDKLSVETKQPYRQFLNQAISSSVNAEAFSWMLIAKRDYKETMVYLDAVVMFDDLAESGACVGKAFPAFVAWLDTDHGRRKIYGTTLSEFFKYVKPKHLKDLHKRWER